MTKLIGLSAALLACAGDPGSSEGPPVFGGGHEALVHQQGGTLNGGTLNGGTLNGNDLSNVLIKLSFAGAAHGNAKLDHCELRGTSFWGTHSSAIFSGEEFLLAEFPGTRGDGSPIRVRIGGMRKTSVRGHQVDLYFIEYMHKDGDWKPACYDPVTRTPTWAIPVLGHWDFRQGVLGGGDKIDDPGTFTFSCLSGAIAKCITLGYLPWIAPLDKYHQACTRLLRADYCGDGRSYTQEGSPVNLYDAIGIQEDSEDWVFEAEWGPYGARCFHPTNRNRAALPCYNERVDALCGYDTSPNRGALLWSETPSSGLKLP